MCLCLCIVTSASLFPVSSALLKLLHSPVENSELIEQDEKVTPQEEMLQSL